LAGSASLNDGTYSLAAGVLEVVLSNDADGKVAADAVQVTYFGAADSVVDVPDDSGSATPVIADNAGNAFSMVGAWKVSDKADGYYGADYAFSYAGDGSSTATFTFQIPASGSYEIAAMWPAHDSRAPNAPFTLVNNGVVVDTVRVDQRFDGGRFNLLAGSASLNDGTYSLAAGVLEVVLSNDADGKVAADAVQIVP
jgi:hypothetical protein